MWCCLLWCSIRWYIVLRCKDTWKICLARKVASSRALINLHVFEGSLEVKLPTVWIDKKKRWEESEKRRAEERSSEKRKNQKREDAGAWKGGKVATHCVFPMIRGSGGSKSRLAKAAGAEPCGQMRNEKLHAVVARSTFASETAQNTSRSDHVWKLNCQKSARCCGAKHICKWKSSKHSAFWALLEVDMSKKCTPLWHKAHLQVKPLKTPHIRSTSGSWYVEKAYAVVAWSTFAT